MIEIRNERGVDTDCVAWQPWGLWVDHLRHTWHPTYVAAREMALDHVVEMEQQYITAREELMEQLAQLSEAQGDLALLPPVAGLPVQGS